MSTESHNTGHAAAGEAPRNADVSFEARDITTSTIYWYLIVLVLAVAASFGVCVYILRYTSTFVEQSHTAPPASRSEHPSDFKSLPPEPMLQGVPGHDSDPQSDLRKKIQADTEANEQFGWVDHNAGIAQIPVKDAMKILAEKGLPAVTPPAPEKKK
jgi:hypothetical protein